MADDFIRVAPTQIEEFMKDVLVRTGVGESEATTVARVLIAADRRGIPSHGCARFKGFYVDRIREGLIDAKARPEIVRNLGATAVVDGHNGLGHPTGLFSMDLAIAKAREHGLGMVVVRNSNHYGIAAYYAMRALEQGMIGITGTNARPSVAPTRGVEAMYGTNPIAVAMPSDDECPFVFDAATTIAQRGKVETYARRGKELPRGWVIGQDGTEKTSPQEVLEGLLRNTAALLPLGGMDEESGSHKGFGMATVVELLSSALQQGAFLRDLSGFDANGAKVPNRIGHFFMAIDVAAFSDVAAFRKTVGTITRELRASRRAQPGVEILTAGIPEYRNEKMADAEGIALDPTMARDIAELRKEYGLTRYAFSFC